MTIHPLKLLYMLNRLLLSVVPSFILHSSYHLAQVILLSVLIYQPHSTRGFAKDLSIRNLVDRPKLHAFQVFEWGSRQQGKHEYTVYGRLITQKKSGQRDRQLNSSDSKVPELAEISPVWMYRGQASQSIQWAKKNDAKDTVILGEELTTEELKSILRKQSNILDVSGFMPSGQPTQFQDLEQLYIVCQELITIADDPVVKSLGYTLDEQRVFQAYPPYHLVAYQRTYRKQGRREHSLYYQGRWLNYVMNEDGRQDKVSNEQNMSIQYIAPKKLETLHYRLWAGSQFHVGGAYVLPSFAKDSQEAMVKVIDRRYERVGGMWLERIEWSVDSFMGGQRARISLDQKGLISLIELDKELFALPTKKRLSKHSQTLGSVYKKEHLPMNQRPISLRFLQQQKGRLSSQLIQVMTQTIKTKLLSCLKTQKTIWEANSKNLHVVFRLNTNEQGRLLAAGATHHLAWGLTRCMLKSFDSLKFPKAQFTKNTKLEDLRSQPYRGSMLAWTVDLKKLITTKR